MILACPQQTYSVFGPCSSPLYYTTLSRLPNRLVFAGLHCGSLCSVVLTSADLEAPIQQRIQAHPVEGVCTWPLTATPTYAEMVCTWSVEETEENRDLNGDGSNITPGCVLSGTQPPREGRFRVLNAESRDRLRNGQQKLRQMSDDNLIASAKALLMAEFGLYHEALLIVEIYLKSQRRRKNLLLARTVQTLIYKQMLRQIEQEQRLPVTPVVPFDWYNTWTVNRERYHRDLSIALMKGQCPRRCLKEISSVS